jgi:hypothetical protein
LRCRCAQPDPQVAALADGISRASVADAPGKPAVPSPGLAATSKPALEEAPDEIKMKDERALLPPSASAPARPRVRWGRSHWLRAAAGAPAPAPAAAKAGEQMSAAAAMKAALADPKKCAGRRLVCV